MKVRLFTMRFDVGLGRFDDREFADFQEGKEVLDVSEHFFVHEHVPTIALVVRYREQGALCARPGEDASRRDWRAELDEPGQRLYDELRLWRGCVAKREGIAPYLVLTNRQMAEVASRRPSSALREIEGIGEAKSDRWGQEMIAVVAACSGGSQCPNA